MRAIHELSSQEFEHLIFDLLIFKGMKNLVWRTPGRDGGRDIEGYYYHYDIAGHLVEQHWYIECKMRTGTVDWPTVFGKVAYAKNASVEYLLMVSNSKFSPQCIDEIEKWNSNTEKTKIRFWSLHDLEWELSSHIELKVKYNLTKGHRDQAVSLLRIALLSSKYMQSAYSMSVFFETSNNHVEVAAAFSEYLLTLISYSDNWEKNEFNPSEDQYEWVKIDSLCISWPDRFFLRALLSSFKVASKSETVHVQAFGNNSLKITGDGCRCLTQTQIDDMNLLGFWADCEITVKDKTVILIVRNAVNG